MYFDVSPDGTRVAYSTCKYDGSSSIRGNKGYRYGISVIDMNGTNNENLTKGDLVDTFPVWSPDGTRLAFVSAGNPDAKMIVGLIAIYTVETGKHKKLYLKEASRVAPYAPVWSPDGRTIAFVAYEPDETADTGLARVVYTVGVDSSNLTRISKTLTAPSWSTAGKRIAFLVPDPDVAALYSFAADGTDPVRVAELPGAEDLIGAAGQALPIRSVEVQWSPDDLEILLGTLAIRVAADGSGTVESLPVSFNEHPYSPMVDGRVDPKPRFPRIAAWSPDGSRIAVANPRAVFEGVDVVLHTIDRNGTEAQALVRTGVTLVAENSGWQDPEAEVASACSAGFIVSEPENNPGLVNDCETLIRVRDDLSGDVPLNWGSGVPIEEWAGVTVESVGVPPNSPELRVTRLSFPSRRYSAQGYFADLGGRIPPELGGLEELRVLELEVQGLDGEIPPQLGNLNNLNVLNLNTNNLSGVIPPELGNLKDLVKLDLYFNRLNGELPHELGNLHKLEELDLSFNSFSGVIPASLATMRELRVVNLQDNNLIGGIPEELGSLQNLVELNLSYNQLDGNIPTELEGLENLRVLDLELNSLNGSIPVEVGNIMFLEELMLGNNNLAGRIPTELGRLGNLSRLELQGNSIDGCIPSVLHEKFYYLSDIIGLPFCE